jgi:hypothetical protein
MPSQLRAEVRFDSTVLAFMDVVSSDLAWDFILEEAAPGMLRIEGWPIHPSGAPCMILRFRTPENRDVLRNHVSIPRLTAYALCCEDADSLSTLIYVDGICNPLVRRRDNINLFPQPAAEAVWLTGRLQDISTATSGVLRLYAADGAFVCEYGVDVDASGNIRSRIDLSAIRPGSYTGVLHVGHTTVVKRIVVL